MAQLLAEDAKHPGFTRSHGGKSACRERFLQPRIRSEVTFQEVLRQSFRFGSKKNSVEKHNQAAKSGKVQSPLGRLIAR